MKCSLRHIFFVIIILSSLSVYGKVVVALSPLVTVSGVAVEGGTVNDVFQAELSQSQSITMVDRGQMRTVLEELKLGQQGMLNADSAREIGKIVGARYFCSAGMGPSGDKIMATVKVIDVETTLTKLDYVNFVATNDAVVVGKMLAAQVEKLVVQFETERVLREKDAVAAISAEAKKIIPKDWKRPTVMIIIREMHVQQPVVIDPAGETEMAKRLIAEGFKVVDSEYVIMMKADQLRAKKLFNSLHTSTEYAANKKADILLYGEAISERAANLGDFEGCRARLELKAIRTDSDEVLLADSAFGGATDLAETVAGKKAIQQAANRLADTFLYSLAEKWHQGK